MPLAHSNGLSIFFAHVPKTGGSSVEDYLFRRFGTLSLLDLNKRVGKRGTGLIVPATHLAAEDLAELIPPDVAYMFAVVRHPLDRLMSEYRYQNKVSRMSRLGFPVWLRVMIHATRMEPRVYENHVRPQVDLIPEGAQIFRLEDGFEALIEQLDTVVGETAPDVTMQHLNKRKKEPLTLSKGDVVLIEQLYAEDFAKFGYDLSEVNGFVDDKWAVPKDILARGLAWLLVRKQRRDWVR